jgi:methylated-DNA-[protein]-cysteine S-methyltransferase
MHAVPSRYKTMYSPVGELQLVASEAGIMWVGWEQPRHPPRFTEPLLFEPAFPLLLTAELQLEEYFAGERQQFDLPLDLRGTEFQQRVWTALQRIPHGETCSYLDIARSLGDNQATRAVGAANGRNPLPIIVPCHRVIAANGALTGFGGGIERKRWLLAHESKHERLFE